jgi:uncharacterized protein with NAD-binding domain and iron-sulfur cluster
MSDGRVKVAVLGGGPAALSAAFELTATSQLRERYEVTVYQLGWRLGGKGASGRNHAMCDRIEEHGLHVWFGCYDNAFSLIRRCYEERGAPADAPLATWKDAFKPSGACIIYEHHEDRWIPHEVRLPPTPFEPGDRAEHSPWEVLRCALGAVEGQWRDLLPELGMLCGREAARQLGTAIRVLGALDRRGMATAPQRALIAHMIRFVRGALYRHVVQPRIQNDELRYLFMLFDLVATVVQGIATDDLVHRGWSVINDCELTEWLARHGATDLTLDGSPFLRAIYDGSFAYEDGDKSKPSMAAGKAIQDYIRGLLFYKGAFLWKMQAGMGDTVFGPLYDVLSQRGVRFEFFSAVTHLSLAQDRRTIDAIDIVRQVDVTGEQYEPMCTVTNLRCWPNQPDWSQIVGGDALAQSGINLEQNQNPANREPQRLQQGTDFDLVVLGIPPDVQRSICQELLQDEGNPAYSAMIDNTHSVMTQAFQLWIDKTVSDLGWPYQSNSLMSCYVEPVDTYCNMDQLTARECWPTADGMVDIAYFCGVLPHAGIDTQEQADIAAFTSAENFLEDDTYDFWPRSVSGAGFDWRVLLDLQGRQGAQRLRGQYVRANFAPTERYVLSLPGTIKYRLWPDQSGYDNLFLAGDWTRNGIDAGSIESAVTSGMLAAQAICGQPTDIAGISGWLGADRADQRR